MTQDNIEVLLMAAPVVGAIAALALFHIRKPCRMQAAREDARPPVLTINALDTKGGRASSRAAFLDRSVVQSGPKFQFGRSLAGILLFALFFPGFCVHACRNGQPYPQILLAFACVFPVFLFVRQGLPRILATVSIVFLAYLPVNQYNRLVHSGRFIGTTDVRHINGVASDRVAVRAVPLWHTGFSHLYALETKPSDKDTP